MKKKKKKLSTHFLVYFENDFHRYFGPSIHLADRADVLYQLTSCASLPQLPSFFNGTWSLYFCFSFFFNTVNAIRAEPILTQHVHRTNNDNAVCTEPFTRNVQQPLCKCTITPRTCGSHNALAVQAITRGRRDKNCWLFLHTGRACKATDILTDSCDTFRPADIQYSTQHRL